MMTPKTGKKRYFFARTVREGAVGEMPAGYEATESINGVVSVRRIKQIANPVPAADLKLVETALKHEPRLRWYKVDAAKGAIVIYEPDPNPEQLRALATSVVFAGVTHRIESYVEERMTRARYAPVMKFEREGDDYSAYRMTYRGHGGWSYPLTSGKLQHLVKKLVPTLGTDDFFNLF